MYQYDLQVWINDTMIVIKIDPIWRFLKYLQMGHAFFFAYCDFILGYILNNIWKKIMFFFFKTKDC